MLNLENFKINGEQDQKGSVLGKVLVQQLVESTSVIEQLSDTPSEFTRTVLAQEYETIKRVYTTALAINKIALALDVGIKVFSLAIKFTPAPFTGPVLILNELLDKIKNRLRDLQNILQTLLLFLKKTREVVSKRSEIIEDSEINAFLITPERLVDTGKELITVGNIPYIFEIREEQSKLELKRRYIEVRTLGNLIVYVGRPSFTTSEEVLIKEAEFRIQSNLNFK
jgi:hypothetical protein